MPLLLNCSDPWRSYLTSLQQMSIDCNRSTHIQGKVRQGLTNLTGKDMTTLLDSDSFLFTKWKEDWPKVPAPQSLSHTEKNYGTKIKGVGKNTVSYDILYCWRVNSRLLLSDLIFCSSIPRREGQIAQALHLTRTQEVRRNCIVKALEKRKGS